MFESIATFVVYDLLELEMGKVSNAIHFFIYDTLKIVFLIFLISFVMGLVNLYLPIEKLRNFLTKGKLFGLEYLFASLFGAITPFCTCSSIPLFIGFVKGGIPLGVTFAFLITSPLVNEIAVAVFLATFGLKATLIYAGSGIIMGVIGGYVLGRFNLERYLSPWVLSLQKNNDGTNDISEEKTSFISKLPVTLKESLNIVRSVMPYVLIGIGIGAVIHNWVPEGFFDEYLSKDNPFAVPLAVIVAVPMYGSASAIVPVIQVLVAKGIPLGTAIAFMMSIIGLSLPEATLLKKVMTWRLIFIFFGTVALFIILLGYLFNLLL